MIYAGACRRQRRKGRGYILVWTQTTSEDQGWPRKQDLNLTGKRRTAALNHKLWDDPMDDRAFVPEASPSCI